MTPAESMHQVSSPTLEEEEMQQEHCAGQVGQLHTAASWTHAPSCVTGLKACCHHLLCNGGPVDSGAIGGGVELDGPRLLPNHLLCCCRLAAPCLHVSALSRSRVPTAVCRAPVPGPSLSLHPGGGDSSLHCFPAISSQWEGPHERQKDHGNTSYRSRDELQCPLAAA